MFDDAYFDDVYDLFRPTESVSASGVASAAEPGTATSTAQPCKLIRKPGHFGANPAGADYDYHATLLTPASAGLRPEKRGELADVVLIDGESFTVVASWDAAAAGLYNRARLKEQV